MVRTPNAFPHCGVHNVGIHRIDNHIDGGGGIGNVQHSFPGIATIQCAVNSALGIFPKQQSRSCHKNILSILRIDGNACNIIGMLQPQILPGEATIGGAKQSVSRVTVAAGISLSRTHINRVGSVGINCQCSDGKRLVKIEHRCPFHTAIAAYPHTPIGCSNPDTVRLAGMDSNTGNAPSDVCWASRCPVHCFQALLLPKELCLLPGSSPGAIIQLTFGITPLQVKPIIGFQFLGSFFLLIGNSVWKMGVRKLP